MSKAVKRVSKTVERVTRVMMVSLVALLGAQAEAHYIVVGGTPKRCNHCVEGEVKKDEDHKDDGHQDVAEFRLKTKVVDYQCAPPAGSTTPIVMKDQRVEVDLVVLKQIVEGDVTSRDITKDARGFIIPDPPETFNLVAEFSDSLLKEVFRGCGSVPPIDAAIRETALKIVSYSCTLP